MCNKKALIALTLSLSLTALTSCRFGNRTVESTAPVTDAFSKFEIAYSNKPYQYEYCAYFNDPKDANNTLELCKPGDVPKVLESLTNTFTDPLGLMRKLNTANNSIVWGFYHPNVSDEKFYEIPFDQTTGVFSFDKFNPVNTLWPAADPQCLTQQEIFFNGKALPEQQTLGLFFATVNWYSTTECVPTLQKVANCLDGVANACTANELKFWQDYFGPHMTVLGITTDDIPLLIGRGFKVSFR